MSQIVSSFSKKNKAFLKSYFRSLLISLILVAIFNIIIDPYQYFFTPKITGLNAIKPEYEKHIMLSKAAEAKQIKAETIILGSSRIMSGIESSYDLFKKSDKVFNLGLPGINMYQSLQYFKHALYFQKDIKLVIIGIDFFMFNDYLDNLDNFDEERLEKRLSIQDSIGTTLSIDTLAASLKTLDINRKNEREKNQESTTKKFQRWLTNFLEFRGFYKTYRLSQKQLDSLKLIIDLCRANNIDYRVFISPTHATQYEAIEVAGLWTTFEKWKKEVVKITPVWDFSGYNSITTEVISESMTNYIDNSHYSSHTGELVLNKIFAYQADKIPQDFGIFVDRGNLASHLHQIRLNRDRWRQNNVREVELVRKIQTNVDRR